MKDLHERSGRTFSTSTKNQIGKKPNWEKNQIGKKTKLGKKPNWEKNQCGKKTKVVEKTKVEITKV